MKKCRHLEDFQIDSKAIGPNTGLPPWLALCEDCSASVVEALRARMKAIEDQHPSGKSGRAVQWAKIRGVLEDACA
jgi:hypothetical protein